MTHPAHPDPLCHALQTEAMLTVLTEWLRASAGKPAAQRLDCALVLAEQSLRTAVRTREAIDTLGGAA